MDNISETLKRIIQNRYNITIKDDMGNKNLLGKDLRIGPGELLYLYFDIEREFSINIPQAAIISDKFNTFNNIVQIIRDELNLRNTQMGV
jgi:peptide maturation system acyl carrier-related protein